MKPLYLFLLLLVLPFIFAEPADVIDKTTELLREGNIHELAKSFSSSVELDITDEDNVYPSIQAEQILDNFFKQYQVKSVKVLHRITSNANYRYAVVIINTNRGIFRTSFALKNVNGSFELNELRIESEKTK